MTLGVSRNIIRVYKSLYLGWKRLETVEIQPRIHRNVLKTL